MGSGTLARWIEEKMAADAAPDAADGDDEEVQEALERQFSANTYDKLLAKPNLSPEQRAQLEKMKAKRLAKDAAAAGPQPQPGKGAWPELVGQPGEAAVATIKAERPDLAQVG